MLKTELLQYCQEIILIDQNYPSLCFQKTLISQFNYFKYHSMEKTDNQKVNFLHLCSIHPSVTKAKNIGIEHSKADVLVFFDDDITAIPGVLREHIETHKIRKDIGFIAGREIIKSQSFQESKFKNFLINFISLPYKLNIYKGEEQSYTYQGEYIGRVTKDSFHFCNFSIDTKNKDILVDTVRGCNCSLKKDIFYQTSGFDENFQGTALREETDLCLRVLSLGLKNIYHSKASVIHRRQMGGCNNLGKSYTSLLSKLDNELYFQNKHFAHTSSFIFLIRIFPHLVTSLKATCGASVIICLQYIFKFISQKRSLSYESKNKGQGSIHHISKTKN